MCTVSNTAAHKQVNKDTQQLTMSFNSDLQSSFSVSDSLSRRLDASGVHLNSRLWAPTHLYPGQKKQ